MANRLCWIEIWLICIELKFKRLNEKVKRNSERFPESFRFQLSDIEKNELVTNCDRFEKLKYASTNPYAFTEQGVTMLSAVLRSDIAVRVSIQIINAFVRRHKKAVPIYIRKAQIPINILSII